MVFQRKVLRDREGWRKEYLFISDQKFKVKLTDSTLISIIQILLIINKGKRLVDLFTKTRHRILDGLIKHCGGNLRRIPSQKGNGRQRVAEKEISLDQKLKVLVVELFRED